MGRRPHHRAVGLLLGWRVRRNHHHHGARAETTARAPHVCGTPGRLAEWINFVHLFIVSLIPFSTAWVSDTRFAAVPMFGYGAVFVLVNLAYIPFEWHALASAPVEEISARTRRFARLRSSVSLATFIAAMAVSLRSSFCIRFDLLRVAGLSAAAASARLTRA